MDKVTKYRQIICNFLTQQGKIMPLGETIESGFKKIMPIFQYQKYY